MGHYSIVISGYGAHHAGGPTDADRIARETIDRLRAGGHQIDFATFMYGSGLECAEYLDQEKAIA